MKRSTSRLEEVEEVDFWRFLEEDGDGVSGTPISTTSVSPSCDDCKIESKNGDIKSWKTH